MNVLITAGATREPVDAVRFLSNLGTGSTGAALADALRVRGHRVAVLRGAGSVAPGPGADDETFGSAADLLERLRRRLSSESWDLVVMTAAVADYRPADPLGGKLGSEAPELALRLVRNPKILPQLKSFSPGPLRVVGFKLTVGADEDARRSAVAAQFAGGGVDAVVHNDLSEIRRERIHPFWFYRSAAAAPARTAGAGGLALALDAWAGQER
jgi:phosphopantothenoylcysteine decarboxylase/phosphopantothenate--cysteine ligase